jgi:uncharacterized repeat protein (TIGR01451 family)
MLRSFCLTIVTMLTALLLPLHVSAADGAIKFSNLALKEVTTTNAKGEKVVSYVEPTLAVPGDTILYSIKFENISKQAVSNIVVDDPIPNNSSYRLNTATGKNTKITFSIDSGKTFGNPQDLVVKDKSGKSWVAKPEDYTHIRWIYEKALAPGAIGEVFFMTKIKGSE